MTTLLDVYRWHIKDRNKLADLASMFAEEVNLNEEQTDELFKAIINDNLNSFELYKIIDEHYHSLTLSLIVEETSTADLKRKINIERERKKLGRQYRKTDDDTPEQAINKSVNSLSTFKIDKEGRFQQRKDKGDIAKIRTNLQRKKTKFLTSQGKISAAKASEERKRQARAGGKTGAAKFVSKLVKT